MMDSLKNKQEGGDFKIEYAKPEDVETIRAIVKNAWLALYPNKEYGITIEDISAIDWYDAEAIARRKKEISENQKTLHVWVVKNSKNEIVGFCKVLKLSDSLGEIDAMYVLPEMQGRGLGKKLMDKAMKWLGPNLDVKLVVVKYNIGAIGFYKKMGFREVGDVSSYNGTALPSGKAIPRIEMIKDKLK